MVLYVYDEELVFQHLLLQRYWLVQYRIHVGKMQLLI